MNIHKRIKLVPLLALGIVMLSACSSGDDGIDGTGLAGTAAIGAPIANTSITVKGKDGNKKSSQTDANGKYEIDVKELNSPYLMKINASSNRTLFSIASQTGTTNIHPFTDLIVRNWFTMQGLDIEAEFETNVFNRQSCGEFHVLHGKAGTDI